MSILKKLACAAAVGASLAMSPVAQADQEWAWSYVDTLTSGSLFTASGTFYTPGPATSYEVMSGLTGTLNGQAITGLLPFAAAYGNDNKFSDADPYHFSTGGVLFSVLGGAQPVNIYGDSANVFGSGRGIYDWNLTAGKDTKLNFSVTAVPEPETFAMLLSGLGLIGFIGRRRSTMAAANA